MMITAKMVSELREKTGAGMMDCKRALTAADGDMEAAIDNLRKSGIAKAEKKTGRATNQGKVLTAIEGKKAAIAEVLCETDFAAKTDRFIDLVKGVATRALAIDVDGDVTEQVNEAEKAELTAKIATIGENMQIRRALRWNTNGMLASYIHQGGRVTVLVDAEGDVDAEFLTDVCMHIAAFRPAYIDSTAIPADVIEHEKGIAAAQLAGKPANMIEKIVMGKINKWFSEVCLVNQPWIKDDKTSIAKMRSNAKIKRFVRWEVGEEL
ncbi:MAG: translation elongation factor Ts [Victivallaceae bacterium]|nr:translation elongation factor Ts [Victivallaceae bacterium]